MRAWWFVTLGLLLWCMALAGPLIRRLPFSAAIVYLLAGFLLGPAGGRLLGIESTIHDAVIEVVAEIAVLAALFAVGLKLGARFFAKGWAIPLRLAGPGMLASIALTALAGVFLGGLALPTALLLGAVLAPTDPVLASDVQVRDADDTESVRYSLTAEGAVNDALAFPFVVLALGLAGVPDHEDNAWKWILDDLVWATVGAVLLGMLTGVAARRILDVATRRSPVFEDFTALGLAGFAYGMALFAKTYGFLAVFMAALTLRLDISRADPGCVAVRLREFTGQLERLTEVAVVIVVGALLGTVRWTVPVFLIVAALLFVIRPLSVLVSVPAVRMAARQRALLAWFGIRGAGSLYYAAYALSHGFDAAQGRVVMDVTVAAIATSIVIHGVSATPIMAWHDRQQSGES